MMAATADRARGSAIIASLPTAGAVAFVVLVAGLIVSHCAASMPCRAVPECAAAHYATPSTYRGYLAVGLGTILIREVSGLFAVLAEAQGSSAPSPGVARRWNRAWHPPCFVPCSPCR